MTTQSESGKRFVTALEKRGLNFSSLSKQMGTISKMSLAGWAKIDIGKASCGNVILACKILDIRPEWLISGDEPMSAGNNNDFELSRLAKVLEAIDAYEIQNNEKYDPKQRAFILDVLYHDDLFFESRNQESIADTVRRLAKGVK